MVRFVWQSVAWLHERPCSGALGGKDSMGVQLEQSAARAAARKRGVVFGRRPGQRIKAARFAPKVLQLVGEGQSYREISHRLGLSKNTILDIVKRDRACFKFRFVSSPHRARARYAGSPKLLA
jgi:hypothetical protein